METEQPEERPRGAPRGAIGSAVFSPRRGRFDRRKGADGGRFRELSRARGPRDDRVDERTHDGCHERPQRPVIYGGRRAGETVAENRGGFDISVPLYETFSRIRRGRPGDEVGEGGCELGPRVRGRGGGVRRERLRGERTQGGPLQGDARPVRTALGCQAERSSRQPELKRPRRSRHHAVHAPVGRDEGDGEEG